MLWVAAHPLVLASRSPVRRAILEAAGIPIDPIAPDLDERAVEARAGPLGATDAALLLAREKARAVTPPVPGQFVLGADQTLALGPARFTKPDDVKVAREQLRALSGRTHELCSAIAVAKDGRVIFSHCEVARMTMRSLSDRFLDVYLDAAGSAVTTSVGAYQLEKLGIHLFERIEGDQLAIVPDRSAESLCGFVDVPMCRARRSSPTTGAALDAGLYAKPRTHRPDPAERVARAQCRPGRWPICQSRRRRRRR